MPESFCRESPPIYKKLIGKDAEQKHLSMTNNNIVIPEGLCPESIPLCFFIF